MKILSWNCRGLGNPSAVRALRKLLNKQCPDVVFLMETRLQNLDKKAKCNLVCGPLSNVLIIDCNIIKGHRSGGLAILWNDSVNIDFLDTNKNFIDMYITSCNLNMSWFATGMYGYPYTPKKHLTCEAISKLYQNRISEKWLLFGDFNLILNNSEKLGGTMLDFNLTKLFNDTINACDLNDLGYVGNKYTWVNNQPDNTHIKERLDRFFASSNWLNSFPRHVNKHLLRFTSDHNPILLEFHEENFTGNYLIRPRIQRIEHIWIQDQESFLLVEKVWGSCRGSSHLKLQTVFDQLARWGKTKYGELSTNIKNLQDDLERLKNIVPSQLDILKIKATEQSLEDLLKKEEVW
jgi:exonuclease III